MSETSLPEEIILCILSICLIPSPDEFFRFPGENTGVTTPGLHNVLLVSKRWYRIGKPLLYSSIMLRKGSHTAAVTTLLTKEPELGEVVQSLRLDGGYEEEFTALSRVAPNIRNLYIDLHPLSCANVRGLQESLGCFNPHTVYIAQPMTWFSGESRLVNDLRRSVEDCITWQWSSLECIHLSGTFPMSPRLIAAFSRAPRLRELTISVEDIGLWLLEDWDPSLPLIAISQLPNLQAIRCRKSIPRVTEMAHTLLYAEPAISDFLGLFKFM